MAKTRKPATRRGSNGHGNGHSTGNGRASLAEQLGGGGEFHQRTSNGSALTTNQGVEVSDDQNMLRAGARGPALLEDFHFLEKITHFDHERIPERVVHARGSAAHGTFRSNGKGAAYSRAAFLQPGAETPTFTRFSTVAGGAGSVDLPRDVRGFATKFYTSEGVFDLVGNNMPVFFIQDALKFPDLVHSVKMEPDRGFPQNASAHDTFWDFVSLVPEATHTVLWLMSDRAIPRSYRMMEGFGVNTYKLVDARGRVHFIKWHWRPTLGTQSVVWDEAVKINGADQDFHRRDLFEAITSGALPAWELSIQAVPEDEVDDLEFDILDATKLIPEELYPLIAIGEMTLERWPDNFFAETEQVAMHPGHLVPGVEFSDDPLLQGRIFSYTDTQLKRLGGPNFHEIPINRPKCPFANFQRDGMARMTIDRGQTSFEPNSIEPDGVRETPRGLFTAPQSVAGPKLRERAATFADYYSQARMFYRSQTAIEQQHIAAAFTFELSKVARPAIRSRMLGHLEHVDRDLAARVADALGMRGMADDITPRLPVRDVAPSPALSIEAKREPTLVGRKVGCLIADGFDAALVARLRDAVTAVGATFQLVAPKIGMTMAADGSTVAADHMILGGPSVLFDAVAIAIGPESVGLLEGAPPAVQWVADAFAHCKVIGTVPAAAKLLEVANAARDVGVIDLGGKGVAAFVAAAKGPRIWARELMQRDKPPLPNTRPPRGRKPPIAPAKADKREKRAR